MIRINLLQTKKRSRGKSSAPADGAEKRGAIYAVSLMLLLALVGAALYFVLDDVVQETQRVQADTAESVAKTEKIRKLIREDELERRRAELARMEAAVKKVESQRRSPVQVMHELANIMSTGLEPDFIPEELNKCKNIDPECKLDPSWDGNAVWLTQIDERQGGLLEIKGIARDAADLSEFVKRMRISVRFHDVTHPKYTSKSNPQAGENKTLQFAMTARVTYWD